MTFVGLALSVYCVFGFFIMTIGQVHGFETEALRNQALLENLDRWLAQHDRDVTPSVKGPGRNTAGLGIYYFEEPYSEEDN